MAYLWPTNISKLTSMYLDVVLCKCSITIFLKLQFAIEKCENLHFRQYCLLLQRTIQHIILLLRYIKPPSHVRRCLRLLFSRKSMELSSCDLLKVPTQWLPCDMASTVTSLHLLLLLGNPGRVHLWCSSKGLSNGRTGHPTGDHQPCGQQDDRWTVWLNDESI